MIYGVGFLPVFKVIHRMINQNETAEEVIGTTTAVPDPSYSTLNGNVPWIIGICSALSLVMIFGLIRCLIRGRRSRRIDIGLSEMNTAANMK
ncbi:hypothetical protein ECANGB1_862 [Enterospora canceri]|uniref:Uncharacterized protein n=1 Tax=Enterospora canceri TaxID=1081671 RepID=A0A1Y1S7C0_9MICR|nr:hypothetical protein ECANGB1_862 [Enterospora canceri]